MNALLPSPTTIAALVKIGLLIGGLMTAAAYLVLVERWMAAWVQDRKGPNRVGIPLTKIRLFGLGQPLAIDEYVSPWIHHNPLTGQGYNPLDVGIAGRVGNPGQAAQERQIHQQATQGIGA